jgi:hypothetical protein
VQLNDSGLLLWFDPEEYVEPEDQQEPAFYHEAYLRLAEVDLGDLESILGWAREFGPLGARWRGWGKSVHPHEARGTRMDPPADPPYFNGITNHPGFDKLVLPLLQAADKEARANLGPSFWMAFGGGEVVETVLDFWWAACCIRDFMKAWRLCAEGVQPERWECPVWQYGDAEALEVWQAEIEWWEFEGFASPPETPEEAARFLTFYLSDGLASFHPRVGMPGDEQHPYRTLFPFYPICCLELYNHIVEHAVYKTCANEPCGRLFVRQEGRAEHGQHRTRGVKYCSSECARAQAYRGSTDAARTGRRRRLREDFIDIASQRLREVPTEPGQSPTAAASPGHLSTV